MGERTSVFISSTFEDLEEHRGAVFQSIHTIGGHAEDMVYWSAESQDASASSVHRVRESDVLVLLVAHRYGFVPPDSEYSITELEYRAARDAGIPVLAFLVDESHPWPPLHVERSDELDRFREMVEQDVVRDLFTTPDDLALKVTQALSRLTERAAAVHPLIICQRMPLVPATAVIDVADRIELTMSTMSGRPVVLVGAAGSGKSTAASLFVRKLLDEQRCDVAWWVDASSPEFAVRDLAELASVVLGSEAPDEAEQAARAALRSVSSGERRCVLVYDNAIKPEVLRQWLPRGDSRIVVTTRSDSLMGADIGPSIRLEEWSREASLQYLQVSETSLPEDHRALEQVIELVGGLPLALSAVKTQKARAGRRWGDVLRDLTEPGKIAAMDELTSLFETSLADAEGDAEAAPRLLGLLSFLYVEDLRLDDIQEALHASAGLSAVAWEEARAALFDGALLKVASSHDDPAGSDPTRAAMHSLVASFGRRHRPDELRSAVALLRSVAQHADAEASSRSTYLRNWHPHVLTVVDHVVRASASTDVSGLADDLLRAAADLGGREREAAEHRLAFETFQACIRLVNECPSVRESQREVAMSSLFQFMGACAVRGAFDEMNAALEQLSGEESDSEGTWLDLLFALFARLLSACVGVWTSHPRTAGTELIALRDRALEIAHALDSDAQLGELASSFVVAAEVCQEMIAAACTLEGQPGSAMELLAHLPPIETVDAHEVLDLPYVRVADALIALGRADAAVSLLESAEAAHRSVGSPPTDLGLLEVRGFLAAALTEQGRAAAACEILQRNLEFFSQHSLHLSVDFAEQSGFLGIAESALGRHRDAAETLRRAIADYRRFAPEDHPAILRCRRHFADVLLALGDPSAALTEIDLVLDGFTTQRGDEHPTVTGARAARDRIVAARDRLGRSS